MERTEKFEEDLQSLTLRLTEDVQGRAKESLVGLRDRLIELHRSNIVKINHSVMEFVCAKLLVLKGYDVQVEHPLEGGLTCDLYAAKGDGSLIVEVETGFVPPEHALDPSTYLLARIASKVTRYSNCTGKFALGVPPQYALQIPAQLIKLPRERTAEDLKHIKGLCDQYYTSPPVTLEEVKNARLHSIYLIDVDRMSSREVDPETYVYNKQFPAGSRGRFNNPR